MSKTDPYYDPKPYLVIRRKGNMLVAKRPDHTITRNITFFKIVNENNYEKQRDDESDVETIDLENQGQSNVGANDDVFLLKFHFDLRILSVRFLAAYRKYIFAFGGFGIRRVFFFFDMIHRFRTTFGKMISEFTLILPNAGQDFRPF